MPILDHAQYDPALKYDSRTSQSWTTTGTTHTVTDVRVKANSHIVIMHTSAYAGRWFITVSAGSFLITSSDAESAGATFRYLIL